MKTRPFELKDMCFAHSPKTTLRKFTMFNKMVVSPVFYSSNDDMEDPLLVQSTHPCDYAADDHWRRKEQRQRLACWSAKLSSPCYPGLSASFLYFLRPKFILAGFSFGVMMELAYAQAVQLGLVTLVLDPTTPDNYSVRVETWSDVALYELSFLYSDVMFLAYLVILTRYALKKNLSLNLPIMAANCTMGFALGLLVVVVASSKIGPKAVLQQLLWQGLWSVVVWVALCFLLYATAVVMQLICIMSVPPTSFPLSPYCEDKAEQENRSHVHDTTISIIEASIV